MQPRGHLSRINSPWIIHLNCLLEKAREVALATQNIVYQTVFSVAATNIGKYQKSRSPYDLLQDVYCPIFLNYRLLCSIIYREILSVTKVKVVSLMDFFSKMMQTFSSILLPKEINDDELFSQITVALQEESSIWNTQNDFIEPDVIENFQNKWSSAYYTAKKKTADKFCTLTWMQIFLTKYLQPEFRNT